MSTRTRAALGGVLALTTAAGLTLAFVGTASATSADVVVGQVYGGGGNSGATYTNDYVQLVNRGGTAVDLSGWSVQYASAGGTSWQVTTLSGSLPAGGTYLVGEAAGTGGSTPLPSPAVTGSIALSATSGRVALVAATSALSCGAACAHADGVHDFVGYGAVSDAEGTPVPALSNTTAAVRSTGADTDDNAADFAVAAPDPSGTAGGSSPSPTPSPTGQPARIHDIQGAAHRSPLAGKAVVGVPGVVTAVGPKGFWFQDPHPDRDPATSEGLYVFTSAKPTVARGDAVTVAGTVSEYRAANTATNLTTTELDHPTVTVSAHDQAVPAARLIGPGGLRIPDAVRTDAPGDVEASGRFDPRRDALDAYESVEGMLVAVRDAVAVGPTNSYGELPVLPSGTGGVRTPNGGVKYTGYQRANPARLILSSTLAKVPAANTGDKLPGRVDGVLDYSFGNYMLYPVAAPKAVAGGITPGTTRPQRDGELSVATYNVENLAPGDPAGKYQRLAEGIVRNLSAPDIVAVEEIQDNDGAANDGVVAADATWGKLIDAVKAAGGPAYSYRSIDPVDDADGGQPGGNIRVGFLFRTDRGVSFVDRAPGDATTPTDVTTVGGRPALTHSPGRIAPADGAWQDSRKPLAGEFTYRGKTMFVVANHFTSKGGDQPLMGRYQPPSRSSETQRHQQATLVHDFVGKIQAADPHARVVVLGDLNDFEFSGTASTLTAGHSLVDLPSTLPLRERYTYDYEGNSEVLDHVLVSPALMPRHDYQIVHINAEFAGQTSDHDPQIVRRRPGPAGPGARRRAPGTRSPGRADRVDDGDAQGAGVVHRAGRDAGAALLGQHHPETDVPAGRRVDDDVVPHAVRGDTEGGALPAVERGVPVGDLQVGQQRQRPVDRRPYVGGHDAGLQQQPGALQHVLLGVRGQLLPVEHRVEQFLRVRRQRAQPRGGRLLPVGAALAARPLPGVHGEEVAAAGADPALRRALGPDLAAPCLCRVADQPLRTGDPPVVLHPRAGLVRRHPGARPFGGTPREVAGRLRGLADRAHRVLDEQVLAGTGPRVGAAGGVVGSRGQLVRGGSVGRAAAIGTGPADAGHHDPGDGRGGHPGRDHRVRPATPPRDRHRPAGTRGPATGNRATGRGAGRLRGEGGSQRGTGPAQVGGAGVGVQGGERVVQLRLGPEGTHGVVLPFSHRGSPRGRRWR
ncbi:MAG TPA: lamin tail domain-containing protein [Actinocatenispora sp.]